MLKLSTDRKTAAYITPGGTPDANAFGLPSGTNYSCPGATSVCEKICYAGKIEKIYTGVKKALLHNWDTLQACGDDVSAIRTLLEEMLNAWYVKAAKRGAELIFRIHWDGDFYSRAYAQAWQETVLQFPDVQFWVYTRSFVPALNVLDIITGIPNLTVYISVDSANLQYADSAIKQYGVLVASLADTAGEAKQHFSTINSCPENVGGKLPLVVETNGQKKGACAACQLCVVGRRNVAFAISGKE